MMTSGMTSGALTMPENSARPLARGYRTRKKAAQVPKTTDSVPAIMATFSDRKNPSTSRESASKASYQRIENPVKMLSWRVLLNENMIKNSNGA